MPAKCKSPSCSDRALYGYPIKDKSMKSSRLVFCKAHRTKDCVNLNTKVCIHHSCSKYAKYGTNKTGPSYCSTHKSHNMKNVTDKLCEIDKCSKRPSYGYKWKQPVRCKAHYLTGMENVVSKRCKHPNCLSRPLYGFAIDELTHCSKHRYNGMKHKTQWTQSSCKDILQCALDAPEFMDFLKSL